MGKKTHCSSLWIDNEDLPLKKYPFKRINLLWSRDNVFVNLKKRITFWCYQQKRLLYVVLMVIHFSIEDWKKSSLGYNCCTKRFTILKIIIKALKKVIEENLHFIQLILRNNVKYICNIWLDVGYIDNQYWIFEEKFDHQIIYPPKALAYSKILLTEFND